MPSQHFKKMLDKCLEIHDKKVYDYASKDNNWSNFERAALIAGVSVNAVFNVLIGIKIARLEELESSGKTPNNESIEDTYVDLANYSLLRGAYWLSKKGDGGLPDYATMYREVTSRGAGLNRLNQLDGLEERQARAIIK